MVLSKKEMVEKYKRDYPHDLLLVFSFCYSLWNFLEHFLFQEQEKRWDWFFYFFVFVLGR